MSSQVKAMVGSWARVFLVAVITAFLAMQTPPWDVTGDQWLAVLWAGILSVLPVVLNWLNPNDPRYGRGSGNPLVDAPEFDDAAAHDTEGDRDYLPPLADQ